MEKATTTSKVAQILNEWEQNVLNDNSLSIEDKKNLLQVLANYKIRLNEPNGIDYFASGVAFEELFDRVFSCQVKDANLTTKYSTDRNLNKEHLLNKTQGFWERLKNVSSLAALIKIIMDMISFFVHMYKSGN